MSKGTIHGNSGDDSGNIISEIASRQPKSLNKVREEQASTKRAAAIQKKIQKELNLEKDYCRICDITKLLLLLSLLILIVRPYITLLIFFGIVLLNWISFLVIRKKCIG